MRKILISLYIVLLLTLPLNSLAYSGPPLPNNRTEFIGSLNAKSALLFDMNTGSILYEHKADESKPIASVTKVMTILLILEALEQGLISYDDTITTSSEAYRAGLEGTSIYLEVGEVATVEELFAAVVIASANDAATALAETISGTVGLFVAKMNSRAKELGMENTLFKDPCGLDDTAYSTSYDVAIMTKELITKYYSQLEAYLRTYIAYYKDGTSDRAEMLNTNRKFMRNYSYATGLKTGWTTAAGFCLSATAKKDDMHLIAVVLGCNDSNSRYKDVVNLFNYGFAQYKNVVVANMNEKICTLPVVKGKKTIVPIYAKETVAVLLNQSQKEDAIEIEQILPDQVIAPVQKGQEVGKIIIKRDGEEIHNVLLICAEDIPKASFTDLLKRVFSKWLLQ